VRIKIVLVDVRACSKLEPIRLRVFPHDDESSVGRVTGSEGDWIVASLPADVVVHPPPVP
jgi:hypothetical protein